MAERVYDDMDCMRAMKRADRLKRERDRYKTALRGILRISIDPNVRERVRAALKEASDDER